MKKSENKPSVPNCTCIDAYKWSGYPTTSQRVKYGHGTPKPTRLAKDKETCLYCGFYVVWRPEGFVDYPKLEAKPRFDDIEYKVELDIKL